MTDHRTGHLHPLFSSGKALPHRRGPGRSTIGRVDWMGRMHPRDSQREPGSPQGVCVHAKPNRDYDHPQSTQQVVCLPDSPGLSC